MNKIINTLLLSSTLCLLNADMAIVKNQEVPKDEIVSIYSKPSKNSKQLQTYHKRYLNISSAHEETIIKGDNYPWYKLDKGWINVGWIKKDNNKKIVYNPNPFMHEVKTQNPTIVTDEMEKSLSDFQEIKKEIVPVMALSKTSEVQEYKTQSNHEKYFVGASINYNLLSITTEDKVGSIILNSMPNNDATSIELEAGLKIQNYIFSANYEMANLDDVSMNSLYLSLDYQFKNILNPFIGLSLGMSNLTWQIDPLTNSTIKDKKLSSFMYGVEAGIEYQVYKNWYINTTAKYQKLDFNTVLISSPAKSEILHKDKSSLGIGLRYYFRN